MLYIILSIFFQQCEASPHSHLSVICLLKSKNEIITPLENFCQMFFQSNNKITSKHLTVLYFSVRFLTAAAAKNRTIPNTQSTVNALPAIFQDKINTILFYKDIYFTLNIHSILSSTSFLLPALYSFLSTRTIFGII